MEDPTRNDSALAALESQMRECYGRVVYSHKAHEKCADLALSKLNRTKLAQIALAALTTGGLIAVVFGDPSTSRTAGIVAALLSTMLLGLNTYTKDVDPGALSQRHKETASQLWGIRESYLSCLTDLRASFINLDEVRSRRDELQAELGKVYSSAPRTTRKGYAEASKALKVQEDLTFSDAEIDQFLPQSLRKGSSA